MLGFLQFMIVFHDYWQVVAIVKSTFICIWWWGKIILHLFFVICSSVAAGDVHKAKVLYINLNRKSIGSPDDTNALRKHNSFPLKAHLRSLPISFEAVCLKPGLFWCLANLHTARYYWDLRVVNHEKLPEKCQLPRHWYTKVFCVPQWC